jgi:hypothetical protein
MVLKSGVHKDTEIWELRNDQTILATMSLQAVLLHYAYFKNFEPTPSFEQHRLHFDHIRVLINTMSEKDWDNLNYPDHIEKYYDQHIRSLNWVVRRRNNCYLLKNFWMEFEDNGLVSRRI